MTASQNCEGFEWMKCETSCICTLIVNVFNLLHESRVNCSWKGEKLYKGITQVLVELRVISYVSSWSQYYIARPETIFLLKVHIALRFLVDCLFLIS